LGGAGFEIDPLSLFEDAPAPYAFFGVLPALFDAPSRIGRQPLGWLARSFLAWTPLFERPRWVVPVLGFSWGFDIDGSGSITQRDISELGAADWLGHRHTCASATRGGSSADGRVSRARRRRSQGGEAGDDRATRTVRQRPWARGLLGTSHRVSMRIREVRYSARSSGSCWASRTRSGM
jgi:hypothetical protein